MRSDFVCRQVSNQACRPLPLATVECVRPQLVCGTVPPCPCLRPHTHTPTNRNSCFVCRCLSSLWLSTATPTLLSRRLPFRCYARMRCPTVQPCQELTNHAAFYHQICRYRHCCLLVFPLNPYLCVAAPRVVPAYYTEYSPQVRKW